MKKQTRHPMVTLASSVATVALATLLGCAEAGDAEIAHQEHALEQPIWEHCARQGGHCYVESPRRVRYGRSGRYTVRTFSRSIRCDRNLFPRATLYRYNNVCEVDISVPDPNAPAAGSGGSGSAGTGSAGTGSAGTGSAGTGHDDHAGSGGTGGSGSAGTGDSGSAGTGHDDHAGTGGSDSAGAGGSGAAGTGAHAHPDPSLSGPYINLNAIPKGDPGTSQYYVAPTSERPGDSDGTGSFRTVCSFSHMNFDDPIVSPGVKNSTHLHAFFGNTAIDAYSTASSIRNTGNSTCRGGIANRTAYWVPSLIDRNGTPLLPDDMNIYYKTGYLLEPRSIRAFPQGLRMIAGDAKASGPQEHVWWACDGTKRSAISQCSGRDDVTMTVQFPQCWDGKNLDSADHKSHMAYPDDDRCPSSHPVPIPEITYNLTFQMPSSGTAGLRLSSDMYSESSPGGYSIHGDWFDGWDHDLVNAFVKNCDNAAVDCRSHLLGDGRMIYR